MDNQLLKLNGWYKTEQGKRDWKKAMPQPTLCRHFSSTGSNVSQRTHSIISKLSQLQQIKSVCDCNPGAAEPAGSHLSLSVSSTHTHTNGTEHTASACRLVHSDYCLMRLAFPWVLQMESRAEHWEGSPYECRIDFLSVVWPPPETKAAYC